jgi:late competence protein required for DNA uptake (superfamily II DNA/RNA helicase)
MKIRRPSIRRIGRKIRGLIHSCERCGVKREELFKMYTFTGGKEERHYYCRRCYNKMFRR